MSYADNFLQCFYGEGPQPKSLDMVITVDLSGLSTEDRLALAEKKSCELEAKVAMLIRMQPVQGCEGR